MRRIKYIAQIQQTECGLCVMTMLLNYYGAHYSLYDVRQLTEVGRDGLSLQDVIHILNRLGLKTRGLRCLDIQYLRNIKKPFIITFQKKHLVIVEKVTAKAVYVVDPAVGRVKYSFSELVGLFDGICIEIEPGDGFRKKPKDHKMIKIIFSLAMEKKLNYLLFSVLSFVNYAFMIALPIYIQRLFDGMYQNANSFEIVIHVIVVATLYIISALLVKFYMTAFKIDIDKKINTKLINHMIHLPYVFFETRKKSDILYTLNHVSSVREVLVTNLLGAALNVGVALVICMYFFLSNPVIAFALNIMLIPNVLLTIASQKILADNMRKLVSENSKVQGYQTEMLYAMFHIKTQGIEEGAFEEWREKYYQYNQKYGYNEKISSVWNTILNISQILSPLFVMLISILLSKSDLMTIGEMIALFSLAEIFFGQIYGFFNSILNISLQYVYIERLGDIFFAVQKKQDEGVIKSIGEINTIKVNALCFRYTKNSEKVLNNINLAVKRGEKIAIVGKSGSGKSTLLKMLSGLYDLSDGEILINGEDSRRIERRSLLRQIGIVTQEVYLFNKTIYDNLVGERKDVTNQEIEETLKLVNIYDEIIQMPMGINTVISEMGTNLSGGQRQKIILARELLKHPSVLLLDEATSALDYINEKQILKRISDLEITCIMVTHRVSSIQDADEILFMESGKIVERGRHEDLMKQCGYYLKMYNNEG